MNTLGLLYMSSPIWTTTTTAFIVMVIIKVQNTGPGSDF